MKRIGVVFVLALLCLGANPFVVTQALAQDPTITIKTAQATANSTIYATFTVKNSGNKVLTNVTLLCILNDGGALASKKKAVVDGVV